MELLNNIYRIGGLSVLSLVEKYGAPLYVYDSAKIKSQYQKLNNAFKGLDLDIHYACKANTNISILKYLHSLGAGLDTVSIQEVYLGLKAGFEPERIMYTPNSVSMDEIDLAVEAGVRINIDNISILEQFGDKYGSSKAVCLRINPHIMAGGNSKISTGHIDSKFGISIHQLRHTERVVAAHNIRVEGLHMHTGSDILDVEVFLRATEILSPTSRSDFPTSGSATTTC